MMSDRCSGLSNLKYPLFKCEMYTLYILFQPHYNSQNNIWSPLLNVFEFNSHQEIRPRHNIWFTRCTNALDCTVAVHPQFSLRAYKNQRAFCEQGFMLGLTLPCSTNIIRAFEKYGKVPFKKLYIWSKLTQIF